MLFLPVLANRFAEDGLWTVERPISARLFPDDDRWKIGWFGRPGARDMREPDVERLCWAVPGGCCRVEMELDRLRAEAGMGIADMLWLMAPSV